MCFFDVVSLLREGGGLPQHLTRYLPFVPTSLVHETTSFLHDSNKLRSLLSLIYSPNKDIPRPSSEKDSSSSSSSSSVSPEDRLEYQMKLEEYLTIKEVWNDPVVFVLLSALPSLPLDVSVSISVCIIRVSLCLYRCRLVGVYLCSHIPI